MPPRRSRRCASPPSHPPHPWAQRPNRPERRTAPRRARARPQHRCRRRDELSGSRRYHAPRRRYATLPWRSAPGPADAGSGTRNWRNTLSETLERRHRSSRVPVPRAVPWRIDAVALGLGAALIRIPAVLSSKPLVFDDGQYGAAAFAIKGLLAVPALVAVALLLLGCRRRVDIVVAGAVAALFLVAVAVPWGVHDVVEQSITYHTDAAGQRHVVSNLHKTLDTLL